LYRATTGENIKRHKKELINTVNPKMDKIKIKGIRETKPTQ
jgi:hypothetical protein